MITDYSCMPEALRFAETMFWPFCSHSLIINLCKHVTLAIFAAYYCNLQNMGRFSALPTQNELAEMKEDLAFKEGEMKKSEYTALGLASGKLQTQTFL